MSIISTVILVSLGVVLLVIVIIAIIIVFVLFKGDTNSASTASTGTSPTPTGGVSSTALVNAADLVNNIKRDTMCEGSLTGNATCPLGKKMTVLS
jgi:hypothetical protein